MILCNHKDSHYESNFSFFGGGGWQLQNQTAAAQNHRISKMEENSEISYLIHALCVTLHRFYTVLSSKRLISGFN